METSILTSTKKMLGVGEDYTPFDSEITVHINSAFSVLNQLGVGPEGGFAIDDAETKWADLGLPKDQTNMVRTYIFLKVRILFDPPSTSFVLDAMKSQIQEHESRLSYYREDPISFPVVEEVESL